MNSASEALNLSKEGGERIGILQRLEPSLPGHLLAVLDGRPLLVPSALGQNLKPLLGQLTGVLRVGEYYYCRSYEVA